MSAASEGLKPSTMSLEEAAQILFVHPDTLAGMARAGTVPACKVGRAWVFSTRLVQEWIDARCQSTAAKERPTGGSASVSLAERLAGRLAQTTAGKRRGGAVVTVKTIIPAAIVAALLAGIALADESITLKGVKIADAQDRAIKFCVVNIGRHGTITQQTANTLTCEMPDGQEVIRYTFIRDDGGVLVTWTVHYPALGDIQPAVLVDGVDKNVVAALTGKERMPD
jgi:excisionase family DNA binding protein